jgi:hypothetical protein
MRVFKSPALLSLNVSVALSAMLLAPKIANANFNRVHPLGQDTQANLWPILKYKPTGNGIGLLRSGPDTGY